MFALNAIRIAVLVLIGNAGYPEVAIYGFHSQAGWIAFNVVAVGIAFWTRRSRWLNRSEEPLQGSPIRQSDGRLLDAFARNFGGRNAIACPVGQVRVVLSAAPIRLLGRDRDLLAPSCGARLALELARCRCSASAFSSCGRSQYIFWLPDFGMPAPLAAASPVLRWSWLVCRVAGTVLTVPLAEELAYRGFLMRRLQSREFESLAYGRVSWFAITRAR